MKNWGWTGWLVTAIAVFSLFPHLSDSLGESVKSWIRPPERVLLGIVDNKLQAQSGMQQVMKLQTREGIVVEIMGAADASGQRKLLDKVVIPDREDAYYHLNSRATNLAITDVDSDGEPDILAPTYDREGRPRLNSIKYDFSTHRFQLSE